MEQHDGMGLSPLSRHCLVTQIVRNSASSANNNNKYDTPNATKESTFHKKENYRCVCDANEYDRNSCRSVFIFVVLDGSIDRHCTSCAEVFDVHENSNQTVSHGSCFWQYGSRDPDVTRTVRECKPLPCF